MKVKINDNVLITAGKDRGKTGKVLRTFKKSSKIIVEKLNIRTRHIKKTEHRPGEKIHYEAPFNASNVKIICPNCNKAVRAGYTVLENKKKQRICKKCNQGLEKSESDKVKTTRKST